MTDVIALTYKVDAMARLADCHKQPRVETSHAEADRVLCDLLRTLGYGEVVDEYRKLPKWYSRASAQHHHK